MSVAKIIEISSTSPDSFDDAVEQGIQRASQTVHNIRSAWVKEMRVTVRDDAISEYQVNMLVTFLLDGASGRAAGGAREKAAAGRGRRR